MEVRVHIDSEEVVHNESNNRDTQIYVISHSAQAKIFIF